VVVARKVHSGRTIPGLLRFSVQEMSEDMPLLKKCLKTCVHFLTCCRQIQYWITTIAREMSEDMPLLEKCLKTCVRFSICCR